ncbi:MAG TPA: choice-of-anchor D domain-containing protein [Streptosporangiaceae bacterium]|nr:choice-of-anchor D domain-containing protein [Streptosporangiaceae bacterium]
MGSVFGRAVVVAGAVVVALGSAAGVAAATPRPPTLAFTPSPFDYGQVAAGQAASHTFTLANTGGQATGRLRVTLAGSAAFAITGDTCHSLAPGKTCLVTVRFTPPAPGPSPRP